MMHGVRITLSIICGLWLSTQSFAWLHGDPPSLGASSFVLADRSIYMPWSLLEAMGDHPWSHFILPVLLGLSLVSLVNASSLGHLVTESYHALKERPPGYAPRSHSTRRATESVETFSHERAPGPVPDQPRHTNRRVLATGEQTEPVRTTSPPTMTASKPRPEERAEPVVRIFDPEEEPEWTQARGASTQRLGQEALSDLLARVLLEKPDESGSPLQEQVEAVEDTSASGLEEITEPRHAPAFPHRAERPPHDQSSSDLLPHADESSEMPTRPNFQLEDAAETTILTDEELSSSLDELISHATLEEDTDPDIEDPTVVSLEFSEIHSLWQPDE